MKTVYYGFKSTALHGNGQINIEAEDWIRVKGNLILSLVHAIRVEHALPNDEHITITFLTIV